MGKNRRGRNEGSIYKRPDGTWRAQVSTHGKRLSFSARTKSECQIWVNKTLGKKNKTQNDTIELETINDLLEHWLEISHLSLRSKTLYQYQGVANKYIIPHIGDTGISNLTQDKLEVFYKKLIDNGVGVRTVRLTHSILHRCLVKAIRYGLMHDNPAHGATLPRLIQKDMVALSKEQVSLFLKSAKGNYYEAFFNLSVITGLRQAELFGLKWADINWEKRSINIYRQIQRVPGEQWQFIEPKTRAGRRTIILGSDVIDLLREHKGNQEKYREIAGDRWKNNGLIFPNTYGNPMDPSNMRIEFNRVLNDAGLQKIRFHDLRHTAASLMLNHGVPLLVISRILGHSKPSVTLDIYGHLLTEGQEEAANFMNSLLGKSQ